MPDQTSASPFPKHDLISSWANRLAEAFGKNIRENLIPIWVERLSCFTLEVLQRSFSFIETNDEKFPTVARCIRVCRENTPHEPSHTNYDDKTKFTKTTDREGRPCIMDLKNKELLYRAADCPEGQEFLAKLKEVAQAKSMPNGVI